MSPKHIARNLDVKRLIDDGYRVGIRNGYLVIYDIPYVTPERKVEYGAVITDLAFSGDELASPSNHQVWFQGKAFPCHIDGNYIQGLAGGFTPSIQAMWDGFLAQYRFSSKVGGKDYTDYYTKMTTYIGLIANEAKAIGGIDPKQNKVVEITDENSVFRYQDTASTRVDIVAASQKLDHGKIAIIGMGGTGYVLEFLSKTPAREIHLFDGDIFLQHNAFRAPGAASVEVLKEQLPKVEYYVRAYDAMRRGLVPHNQYDEENVGQLAGFAFVFLCVDNGKSRKCISRFLKAQGIAFVDCGMEIIMLPEVAKLLGVCRITLSTPDKSDHFERHAPLDDGDADNLYRRNIQIADLNALSAVLAIGKWKRWCGFYKISTASTRTTYSVNTESMTRDEMVEVEIEKV